VIAKALPNDDVIAECEDEVADPDVRSVKGGRDLSAWGWAPIGQESRSATVWPGLGFRRKAGMTPSP